MTREETAIQIESTLFRIGRWFLGRYSPVFANILEIPAANEGKEGTSDDDPLVLNMVTSKEFEALLDFKPRDWAGPPYPVEKLIATLRLATMWDIKPARDWAIHFLSPIPLPAAERVQLSREYRIPEWVDPRLGFKFFATLAKCKEVLLDHRLRLAMYPPDVVRMSCADHSRCLHVWRETWLTKVARQMLHPVTPTPLHTTVDYVEQLDLKGMNPSCQRETIEALRTSDRFSIEEDVISEAIRAITEYQLTLVLE